MEDLLEGAYCSFVDGSLDMSNAERVGEGVDLELQADLYDVERSYHEAVAMSALYMNKRGPTYRDTRPATAPATTTCRWEPYQLRQPAPACLPRRETVKIDKLLPHASAVRHSQTCAQRVKRYTCYFRARY